jgi:hypothetical protein
MAFTAETIYVTLEGGIVLPISGVTDEKTTTDVEVYDGTTYRNIWNAADFGREWVSGVPIANTPEAKDDRYTPTVPHHLVKKRTLWSFPRSGKFTHVVWADLVQGTSPVAPYRIGMTPTSVT